MRLKRTQDGRLDMSQFADRDVDQAFREDLSERLRNLAFPADLHDTNRGSNGRDSTDRGQWRMAAVAVVAILVTGALAIWQSVSDRQRTVADRPPVTEDTTIVDDVDYEPVEILEVKSSSGPVEISVVATVEAPTDWSAQGRTMWADLVSDSTNESGTPHALIQIFLERRYLAPEELRALAIDYSSIYSPCPPAGVETPPLSRPKSTTGSTAPVFDTKPWIDNAVALTLSGCEESEGRIVQTVYASDRNADMTIEMVIYTLPEADEDEVRRIIRSFELVMPAG